jgi:hypothetical protein
VIVLALLLFAIVLAAAGWVVRPSAAAAADVVHPGGQRRRSPRLDQLVGQLRERGSRVRSRTNGNGTNGSHNGTSGVKQLIEAPIAMPAPGPGARTSDLHLEGFDLRSVGMFATRFWGCVMAAVLFGTAVLWFLASLVGLVSAVERFMRGIGFAGFSFLSLQFLFGVLLLAVAFGALMVVMFTLAAALYNGLAHRYGGVRMFTSDSGPELASLATHRDGDGDGAEVPLRRASSNGDGPVMTRVPARVKTRDRARR